MLVVWILIHSTAIVVLTALSQIGGVAYVATMLLACGANSLRRRLYWLRPGFFLGSYAALAWLSSVAAPTLGRVALPCFASDKEPLAMQSPLYCALNRNYVVPQLRTVALGLAADVDRQFPGTVTLARRQLSVCGWVPSVATSFA